MLELKHIWTAPGYRSLTLTLIDPETKREHNIHLAPADVQRMISACADAAGQIGTEGPLDWAQYPTQVYWPMVTPWKTGPRARRA